MIIIDVVVVVVVVVVVIIVRTKRIGETTFANLTLIHFCKNILSIELLKKEDQTAEEEIPQVLKKKSHQKF